MNNLGENLEIVQVSPKMKSENENRLSLRININTKLVVPCNHMFLGLNDHLNS